MTAKVYNDKNEIVYLSIEGRDDLISFKIDGIYFIKYLGITYKTPMNNNEIIEMWNQFIK